MSQSEAELIDQEDQWTELFTSRQLPDLLTNSTRDVADLVLLVAKTAHYSTGPTNNSDIDIDMDRVEDEEESEEESEEEVVQHQCETGVRGRDGAVINVEEGVESSSVPEEDEEDTSDDSYEFFGSLFNSDGEFTSEAISEALNDAFYDSFLHNSRTDDETAMQKLADTLVKLPGNRIKKCHINEKKFLERYKRGIVSQVTLLSHLLKRPKAFILQQSGLQGDIIGPRANSANLARGAYAKMGGHGKYTYVCSWIQLLTNTLVEGYASFTEWYKAVYQDMSEDARAEKRQEWEEQKSIADLSRPHANENIESANLAKKVFGVVSVPCCKFCILTYTFLCVAH